MSIKPIGPRSRVHEWRHGRNCYANHGCRCDVCRSDNREYQRNRTMPRLKTQRVLAGSPVEREQSARSCTRQVDYSKLPRLIVPVGLTWPELVALELLNQLKREGRP